MSTMHAFHSREKSETSHKFPLNTPEGESTEEFLKVLGYYSSKFVKARAEFRERVVENASSATPEKGFSEAHKAELVADAVEGWSFDEPFSKSALVDFLKECPHIVDDLDVFLYDRKSFFGGKA